MLLHIIIALFAMLLHYLLFLAYIAAWLIMLFYVLSLITEPSLLL